MSAQLALVEEWTPSEINQCIFSADGRYRYRLRHTIKDADSQRIIVWIGCNPSVANQQRHDPTVRREIDFSRRWGFGEYVKVNIFGLVSPYPKDLYESGDPIGDENDYWIVETARIANCIVCCWGTHGSHHDRGAQVRQILRPYQMHVLGLNQDGSPAHPLYLPKATTLRPWL